MYHLQVVKIASLSLFFCYFYDTLCCVPRFCVQSSTHASEAVLTDPILSVRLLLKP